MDILRRRIGRSLAPSSSRTTRVRAGIPAERGPRCRTSISGLAPTSRRTRSLGCACRRKIRGRVGGREQNARSLHRPVAGCIAGRRFRNAGSSVWSVVTDVRRTTIKGSRILDRDVRFHAPRRFRRRDAKDGYWRSLSGEAWIHATPVLAFVQSVGRRLARGFSGGFAKIARIFLVWSANVEDA